MASQDLDRVGLAYPVKKIFGEAEIFFFPQRGQKKYKTHITYLIVEMNNIKYPDLKLTDRFIIGECSLLGEIGQN